MSDPARKRMTSDAFIAWAMDHPGGIRFELADGEIMGMAPERASHARLKGVIYERLTQAVRSAGLDCEVYSDGMAIEVDQHTTYEPDAMVRGGPPLPDDAIKVPDLLIVVEVLSPTSRARDAGAKPPDYFRMPSLQHSLIVRTEDRSVIYHARGAEGAIATRIIRSGPIRLDPPAIAIALADPG